MLNLRKGVSALILSGGLALLGAGQAIAAPSTPPDLITDCGQIAAGSRGECVRILQLWLDAAGAHVVMDGIAGPETDKAIKRYQVAHGLVPDGVVGAQTKYSLLNELSVATPRPQRPAPTSVQDGSYDAARSVFCTGVAGLATVAGSPAAGVGTMMACQILTYSSPTG